VYENVNYTYPHFVGKEGATAVAIARVHLAVASTSFVVSCTGDQHFYDSA
jgi:hypothetical protein